MYIQEDNEGRRQDPPDFFLGVHTFRDGRVQDRATPIYVSSRTTYI